MATDSLHQVATEQASRQMRSCFAAMQLLNALGTQVRE
jgi:hypothetical protein